MKNFLSSTKGKIIAGAITLAVIAAAVITVILLNTGYRNIRVEDLNGTSKVTSGTGVIDAFKGQNLKSGDKVAVGEKSDLTLALDSDKHVYAKELTKFRIEAFGVSGKDSRIVIRLEKGSILNEIDNKLLPSESYVVESTNASMSVRGTVFSVSVFFDAEGLCHTVVEVSEGVVEVVDKQGKMPVRTLNAGEKTEVVSRVEEENNEIQLQPDNSGNSQPPVIHENVMRDPETIAVEQAIEAYFNGGELDTTNFDRITELKIFGNVAFAVLDGHRYGRGKVLTSSGWDDTTINVLVYDENEKEILNVNSPKNQIKDFQFAKEMKSLKNLWMKYGNAVSLSGLEGLTEINTLVVEEYKISDITALADLSKLSRLDLENNSISDITTLSGLSNLRYLFLSNNSISDISPLANIIYMDTLYLENNNISDITPLSNMNRLSMLYLNGNNVSDITPLAKLSGLIYLRLNENDISDISPLSNLVELDELNLSYNNISDISSLSNLTKLDGLNLSSNNISDISALSNMLELCSLSLSVNNISDYSPVFNLTKLNYLDISNASQEVVNQIKQALPKAQIKNRS